jgi:hypothetical protein
MASNTSFFIRSVGLIHKPGFLNPTHATELTVLEDHKSLVETLHYYGTTLKLSDIKQRTDGLHRVHSAAAYVARGALNLVAALTVAPIGAFYQCGRLLQTQEEHAATLKGLKYDCSITLVAYSALGMGYAGIKYFRTLLQYDLRLILSLAISTGLLASIIASFRPYHGQPSSALSAYLLYQHFGLVQTNGYPLNYDASRDNETWTFKKKNQPALPRYENSVMFRQWRDAMDHVILSIRDVMGRDINVEQAVSLLKTGDFDALRKMAVDQGKDVTLFDEALRHYDLAWRMNVEVGKQCLTNSDPTSMNDAKSGWGTQEIDVFFGALRTAVFEAYDENNMRALLEPLPYPLESFKTQIEDLNLDQVLNEKAKKFLLKLKEINHKNLELHPLRDALQNALCDASKDEAEDIVVYNRVKKQANGWFHPDKNPNWKNAATQVFSLYKAIISLIDTGTINKTTQ